MTYWSCCVVIGVESMAKPVPDTMYGVMYPLVEPTGRPVITGPSPPCTDKLLQ